MLSDIAKNRFFRDAFGWGAGLWFLGYMLGIMLFPFVPNAFLGWVIMPFGAALAILVLVKRVNGPSIAYYLQVGVVWTVIAAVLDSLFIVQAFSSADYYKLDVYIYYALTFLLPIAVGAWKIKRRTLTVNRP